MCCSFRFSVVGAFTVSCWIPSCHHGLCPTETRALIGEPLFIYLRLVMQRSIESLPVHLVEGCIAPAQPPAFVSSSVHVSWPQGYSVQGCCIMQSQSEADVSCYISCLFYSSDKHRSTLTWQEQECFYHGSRQCMLCWTAAFAVESQWQFSCCSIVSWCQKL